MLYNNNKYLLDNYIIAASKMQLFFNCNFDYIIKIPKTNKFLSPILSVIPLQLLSYYVAKEKNLDVDKPRNLAKSVTVE